MRKLTAWLVSLLVILFVLVPIVSADTTYVVQPGDNLSMIARRFNTTVVAIVEANNIQNPNLVVVGRELIIPSGQDSGVDQPQPPLSEDSPQPEVTVPTTIDSGTYKVKSGDSLIKIASIFGTDYLKLADMNNIAPPYGIYIGQILKVQGAPDISVPKKVESDSPPVSASEVVSESTTSTPTTSSSAPRISKTTVSIPTYRYQSGFIPTDESDRIYPYPRLDFSQVGGPVERSYEAVVLENDYISVMVLPELGGRVYSLKDKATGRELLYQNPVIKPTSWGYREWWLAAGGIEWTFPVADHGLNEWRPWTYSTSADSITVKDVDDRTGMEVGARLSLDADHSYLIIQPWTHNLSSSPQEYQLWLNGMLAPGGNSVSGNTQFIVPSENVIVHSTGDDALPGEGNVLSWPIHDDRDLSFYGNWNGWLGFFAPTNGGFSGVYDHDNQQGLVRAHSSGWPSGLKIFGPSTLPPSLWTDDDSNYVEMWSGATSSFDQYATLEAGQKVDWTEYWYPINGTNGFDFANNTAVLRLQSTESGAEIALAVSTPITGELILYSGNKEVARWMVKIGPGQSLQESWTRSAQQDGPLGLRLLSGGQTLAQTGQVP